MGKRIGLTVEVSQEDLWTWGGKLAQAGHQGVAHVLFQAAKELESLSEQALREAQEHGWDEAVEHLHGVRVLNATEFEIGQASNPYRKEQDDD